MTAKLTTLSKGLYTLIGAALFTFTILLVPAAASYADSHAVKLIVGGKPAPFEVPPYVSDDGVVLAPVDYVRLLGANYNLNSSGVLTITSASGKSFSQSFEPHDDRLMVPLLTTAQQLGASCEWSQDTATCVLKAKLEMVRVQDNTVLIATSYPIYYKTQTLDNPSRLVVDVFGSDLDSPPATVPANSAYVSQIRSGQLDPETVRLVLDLSKPIHFQVASTLQTNVIQLALGTSQTNMAPVSVTNPEAASKAIPVQAAQVQSTAVATIPPGLLPLPPIGKSTGTPKTSASGPTKIVNVEYKSDVPNVYQVVVTTAGPTAGADQDYHVLFLDHPNRLAFDVANSVVALPDAADNPLSILTVSNDNPLFHSVRWGMVDGSGATNGRVVVDLVKPVVYTVSTTNLPDNSGVQYLLSIQESAVATGPSNSIAGKIVIVDAGHGGKDSGAPGANGILEKNFTLAIAKQVRDALIAAGAQPIMTRSDDTFIPLADRSQMGVDAHADYFISIHCDSSGSQNSHSGDTVYYHGNVTACKALAKSIANRLGQLNISIQSDGIKSDFIRFPGVGFSVLRKSPEPAVLVECGYVNDDGDAKCLQDQVDQQQIATGIVAGLRDFVANQ